MKINYNDFGSEMIENRANMNQLDLDTMTKEERKNYISICDNIARTAFDYISTSNADNFPAFRSALHALFAFVGTDTRILSLDAYSVRFIPAVVPYKFVKSKEYKIADKNVRTFKKSIAWACEVSNVKEEDGTSILFPNATDSVTMEQRYYNADVQDHYNACVKFFTIAINSNEQLHLATLQEELARLESIRESIANQKWQFYKDFKNPMVSSTGKALKHAPESIRKNIEDTMADLLSQRELMTVAQLEKEEAQIKGGKKQAKQAKAEASK